MGEAAKEKFANSTMSCSRGSGTVGVGRGGCIRFGNTGQTGNPRAKDGYPGPWQYGTGQVALKRQCRVFQSFPVFPQTVAGRRSITGSAFGKAVLRASGGEQAGFPARL